LSGGPEPSDSRTWAMHIAPVVCGSLEEQQKLRRALDEYWTNTLSFVPTPSTENVSTKAMSEPYARWLRWRPKPVWLATAVVSLSLLLVAMFWWYLISTNNGNGTTAFEPPASSTFGYAATHPRIIAGLLPWALL